MALRLMYITNDPEVALIAEKYGVDRIWIDLESIGKDERQKNINSVKSHHRLEDIKILSDILTKSELMVRVNPWYEKSEYEIETAIANGAQRIMLPMWKTKEETDSFLNLIRGRVKTTLLLETKEAVECLDEVLKNPYIDEVYIGLNDLHLSYCMTFMFEPLANGTVDEICCKLRAKKIPFGFGGIAKIGDGLLPSERIITEHYRLGSTIAILSRSFCNAVAIGDMNEVECVFEINMKRLRDFERTIRNFTPEEFEANRIVTKQIVERTVERIKKERING